MAKLLPLGFPLLGEDLLEEARISNFFQNVKQSGTVFQPQKIRQEIKVRNVGRFRRLHHWVQLLIRVKAPLQDSLLNQLWLYLDVLEVLLRKDEASTFLNPLRFGALCANIVDYFLTEWSPCNKNTWLQNLFKVNMHKFLLLKPGVLFQINVLFAACLNWLKLRCRIELGCLNLSQNLVNLSWQDTRRHLIVHLRDRAL